MKIKECLELVKNAVFPVGFACIICNGETKNINPYCVCEKCELPLNNKQICVHCGKKLGTESVVCEICKTHRRDESEYETARSVLVYEDCAIDLVRSFKFGNKKYLFEPLGRLMSDFFQKQAWSDTDIIIPVPLSLRRRKKRGYNQAEELARIIGIQNNIPINDEVLIKTRDIPYQARLGFKERRKNTEGIYRVSPKTVSLKGKTVLLVDDVMTTGSTIEECSRTLKSLKPKCIRVLTLASTRGLIFKNA